MENKPLPKASLKSIIQKLDANERFEFAKHSPSLSLIEKSVPLQIDTLIFKDLKIQVNTTEYKFGVYKKFPNKSTPRFINFENNQGGSECNVDEYGFNDYSQDFLIENGDVVISSEQYWREACDEQFENNRMERSEKRREWLEGMIRNLQKQLIHLHLLAPQSSSELQKLQFKIAKYQSDLLPFFYRDSGVRPYDVYTQMTITSPRGVHRERFEYNGNVHLALKALAIQQFGNRGDPIEVGMLELNEPILRLPIGVKFKVSGLRLRYPIVWEALNQIIEPSSYPLEYVEIYSKNFESTEITRQEIIEAKKLVILGVLENQKWVPDLEKLRNELVKIKDGFEEEPYEELYGIISFWRKNSEREMGSKLRVRFRDKQDVNGIFEKLAMDFGDKELEDGRSHFLVPLNFTTDLQVSKELISIQNHKDTWFIQLQTLPKSFYLESIALCARVIEKIVKVWSILNWNF